MKSMAVNCESMSNISTDEDRETVESYVTEKTSVC